MTIERRHALLQHDHEGDTLNPGDLTVGSAGAGNGGLLTAIGRGNTLPPLSDLLSTASVFIANPDPLYGLTAGVLGTTGAAWIQVGRVDSAAAYDLNLQPLGGVVNLGAGGMNLASAPLFTGSITSDWNEGAVDSYSAITFKRANVGLTNQPVAYDNANMAVTFNYHGGGYARQIGFVDFQGGVYQRMQQNGTWYGWDRFAMFNGVNGYLRADGYDVWSTSGWARCISLRPGTGSAAIQFYDASRHWGIGSSGGIFYFMHTSTDTSSGAGMTYPSYVDGTTWTFARNINLSAANLSIPAGYGLYLGGSQANPYIADRSSNTYGSIRVGGSKNGYSGIFFDSSYQANGLMFNNGSNEWGLYSESGGWKFYYTGTTFQVQGGPYKPVPWHDFGGTAASARVTRGTGAGSGGSDGDVHYQYT